MKTFERETQEPRAIDPGGRETAPCVGGCARVRVGRCVRARACVCVGVHPPAPLQDTTNRQSRKTHREKCSTSEESFQWRKKIMKGDEYPDTSLDFLIFSK